jgi:hypothetical protein
VDRASGTLAGLERLTVQPNGIAEVLNHPISQELLARDLTRLAYIAKDGTPRSIPIGFTWNGSEIVMCTPTNAAKLGGGATCRGHGQSLGPKLPCRTRLTLCRLVPDDKPDSLRRRPRRQVDCRY